MLETVKQLRNEGSVLAIAPHDNGCFIIDNLYQYVNYNSELVRVDKENLIDNVPMIHRYSHAISISKNHRVFLARAKSSEAILVDPLNQSQETLKVDRNEGDIEASAFSNDESLVSFGSQKGRTYLYDAKKMDYLLTLPTKSDYISTVCFSTENQYLLSSCFNGSNVIYNCDDNKVFAEFTTTSTLEDAIFIQGNRKLFFILRDGASGIYNLEEKKIETQSNAFAYWPTSIVSFVEDKYVAIGTKSKYLILFDIEKNELVSMVPLSFVGISSLAKKEDKLYVGFISGMVQVINLAYCLDAFEVAYKVRDFEQVHQIVQKNVFLRLHPLYCDLFQNSWKETLPKLIDLLAKGDHRGAKKVITPYLEEEKYQQIYTTLAKQRQDIVIFYELIKGLNIKEAYLKVDHMPLLKHAYPYKILEKKWETIFLTAKKLIKTSASEQKRAHRLLEPFARVSDKKDLVLALKKQPEIFFDSEKEIENQNFKGYFKYIQRHAFLDKTPLHTKVELLGERYLERLEKAEYEWDLKRMKYFSEILQQFPKYKTKALLSITKIKVILRLGEALKKSHLPEVFDLMDQYHYIHTHDDVVKVRRSYLESTKQATEYALVGDGRGAYKLLKEYWDIKQCHAKVSSVMKLSFFNEMKKYYENKKVDWPKSIGRYLERFGEDDDIREIAKDVGLLDVVDNLKERYPHVGFYQTQKRVSLLSPKK